MTIKMYHYPACSTCKKALAFLAAKGIHCEAVNIVDTPPSREELKRMVSVLDGNFKKLFNTSGELYRELGMKDKVGSMSPDEAIEILASRGKLVKRPFVLSEKFSTVGFNEGEWDSGLDRD